MSKLVLIDGNAILHRAYHALPPLTTKTGEPINAVYGFISMLLRIISDLKPTHIAVAFDTPKPTFRKAEYAGYQAHRPTMESDLTSQFEKVYRTLDAMRIPRYSVERYEADDVIGTITSQVQNSNLKSQNYDPKDKNGKREMDEVIIVTGDRDLLQLVNDKVKVYMPIKGLSEAKLYGPKEVIERMGVIPEQVADLKALMGDSSDNYPGVAGIGPKTAISLLSKYGNLEEVYKHLGEIPEKVSKKLADEAEMAVLGKKLATIARDVPVSVDLEACNDWKVDDLKLIKLFDEFGFKTLKKRVEIVGRELQRERQMNLI
jgi:DNA polymerase-1